MKRLHKLENILYIMCKCLYGVVLWAMLQWNGPLIISVTIFLFGLPLFIVLLPLIGARYLKSKKLGVVRIGYFFSLLPLIYIYLILTNMPLRQVWSEAGHTSPVPDWVAVAIIVSCVSFLIVATLLFVSRYYHLTKCHECWVIFLKCKRRHLGIKLYKQLYK